MILTVCSIMERRGEHRFFSFDDYCRVSFNIMAINFFLFEGLFTLASIVFLC